MADCKIVNAKVQAAVNAIGGATSGTLEGVAKQYQTAGATLMEALRAAISSMEGATKDALDAFLSKDVEPFVATDLPTSINSLSALLEANRSNFEQVDQQIADSISGG